MGAFRLDDDELIGIALLAVAALLAFGAYKALYQPPRQWVLGVLAILGGALFGFGGWFFLFFKMTRLF